MAAVEPIDLSVRITVTGQAPLVMHNPRTVDPDDEYQAAIKEIADKGPRQTPEDRKRKYDLQWRASLYTEMVKEDGDTEPRERLIVPIIMLFRALEAGGKSLGTGTRSKGAALVRSVTPTETYMVLGYDGPQNIADLAADPRFRLRAIVNPNPTAPKPVKMPSVRAIFPQWEIFTVLHVVTDTGLSWQDFERAASAAGNIGIGDARRLGYGKFGVNLAKVNPAKAR